MRKPILLAVLLITFFITSPIWAVDKVSETEHFIFYMDNQSFLKQADSALSKARSSVDLLQMAPLSYKAKVYIVDDLDEFGRLARGLIPDWGAAVAYPAHQMIIIKSPEIFNSGKSLEELLIHEYVHLRLADKCRYNRIPRWLNEGLAMYLSTEWGWENNLSMSRAAVFDQMIRLEEVELVNRFSERKAQTAYAISYLAVKFLIDEYGINPLNVFINHISEGKSFSVSMELATGSTHAEFENDFRIQLEKQYNIVSLFMDTIFLWIGLSVVVLIGTFLRYKKRREFYKKWEAEEKLHSTDFDYGDPDNPEQPDDDEPWRS